MAEQKKPQVDVRGYMKDTYGIEVTGRDADGGFKAMVPDPESGELREATIDLHGMMADDLKELGHNPSEVALEISSPSNPFQSDEQNPLGFMQQMNFAATGSTTDKAKYLTAEFGKENVKYNKELKSFVVRDAQGDWAVPQAGILESILGTETGTIAGGAIGTKIGAVVGSAFGGVGALPGAIIVGGIGAAIGRWAQIEDAERAGLRSEADWQQLGEAMGKEFLVGVAGGTIVPGVLSVAGKSASVAGKALIKSAKAITAVFRKLSGSHLSTKQAIAKMSGALNSNISPDDVMKYMDAPEQVGKYMDDVAKWEAKNIGAPIDQKTMNPVKTKMLGELGNMVGEAKRHISSAYDQFFKESDHVISRAKVNVNKLTTGDTGITDYLDNLIDNSEHFASEKNVLKKIKGIITKRVDPNTGELPWKDFRSVRRDVDKLIRKKKAFTAGASQLDKETVQQLNVVRRVLSEAEEQTLAAVNPQVAQKYQALNRQFADQMDITDVLDKSKILQASKSERAFREMFSGGADEVQNAVRTLVKNPGVKNAAGRVSEMQAQSAALNMSRSWLPATSIAGSGRSLIDTAQGVVTNPGGAVFKGLFRTAKGLSKATQFVAGMDDAQRQFILSHPEAFTQLMNPVLRLSNIADSTAEGLMQQGSHMLQQQMMQQRQSPMQGQQQQ